MYQWPLKLYQGHLGNKREGGNHSRGSLDSLIIYLPDVARIRNELLIVIMEKVSLAPWLALIFSTLNEQTEIFELILSSN